MIDHISLRVSDFQRSRTFYEAALAPLGYTLVFSNDQEQYAGFAGPDKERIWIGHREGASHGYAHIAVLAKDRATVRAYCCGVHSSGWERSVRKARRQPISGGATRPAQSGSRRITRSEAVLSSPPARLRKCNAPA